MKIIFMGTPEFSIPTLQTLIDSKHQVVACYTQPDKPKGRGNKVQKTPVKELCEQYGIPVYQPIRIRRQAEVDIFKSIEADIAIVVAYGQMLPEAILKTPKYGCLNIHASLLPAYRGAAPYQWSVINGEKTTGITIQQMDVGMDTGDLLMSQSIEINSHETAGTLHDKLMILGGPLILEALEKLEKQELIPQKQQDEEATYAPLLTKDFGLIDWNQSVVHIERLIRGLNPWPSSYTYIQGLMLKIYEAEIHEAEICETENHEAEICETENHKNSVEQSDIEINTVTEAGTVIDVLPKIGFVVKGNEGNLLIKEVQLEGKKRMDAPAFMRGYTVETGMKLGLTVIEKGV